MDDMVMNTWYTSCINSLPVALRQQPPALQNTRFHSMTNDSTKPNKYHGKPCIKCGNTLRYTRNKACVFCQHKISREWYIANREKCKNVARKWRRANLDRDAARCRKRRKENPEKYRAYVRKWGLANRDKRNAMDQRRQARMYGNVTESYDFKAICDHYNNCCVKCGDSGIKLTIDHIKPVSKGGPDIAENIQPLCRKCNSSKGVRNVDHRPDAGPLRWVQGGLFND